jgi:CRISPR-associated endonuclease Cas1
MTALGYRMIRYGDDFLILTATREEAEKALADANALLFPLRLSLNASKTAITPLDLGFAFLGIRIPSALDEETIARSALRKSLFIKETYAFTGVDGDSVVVRKDDALLARLPLHRIAEIVFLGNGAVSTRLLQKCAKLRIPVSFCSPAGWYSSTLKPDSRSWFEILPLHVRRHEALGDTGRLDVARRVVEAKLRNYRHWLRSLSGEPAKHAARTLEEICEVLPDAGGVEALRGYEGSGARLTFHLVNGMAQVAAFSSPQRIPREKPDRFNALLDMLYSLLFTRLNVLLRSSGLNPYLGFLHSPIDNYESLVCDLQEPFRCRMDRLALKLLNRKEITVESFEQKENGAWRLTGAGVGIVIEAFEREEEARLAGEPSTFGQLLAGQVHAMREWVEGKADAPAFFLAEAFAGKPRQKSKHPTTS